MSSNGLPLALSNLLDAMFPGDDARSLPSFCSLEPNAFDALRHDSEALMPHLQKHVGELNFSMDVNSTLKILRKVAPQKTNSFIIAALEVYFTSVNVVESLAGRPAVLFPIARSLPDIDYTLLERVVERSSER